MVLPLVSEEAVPALPEIFTLQNYRNYFESSRLAFVRDSFWAYRRKSIEKAVFNSPHQQEKAPPAEPLHLPNTLQHRF